jgi:hypothetical protein
MVISEYRESGVCIASGDEISGKARTQIDRECIRFHSFGVLLELGAGCVPQKGEI